MEGSEIELNSINVNGAETAFDFSTSFTFASVAEGKSNTAINVNNVCLVAGDGDSSGHLEVNGSNCLAV